MLLLWNQTPNIRIWPTDASAWGQSPPRMADWRTIVAAAEDKKANGASITTLHSSYPQTPLLNGKTGLHLCHVAEVTISDHGDAWPKQWIELDSNRCSAHGDERKMLSILGLPKAVLKIRSASWAARSSSRGYTLSRSVHRFERILSIAGPIKSGDPKRHASPGSMVDSSPTLAPWIEIRSTSSATSAMSPPKVTSPINTILRGLSRERKIGWRTKQKSNGPNGSPCWTPSADHITSSPNWKVVDAP